MKNGVVENVVFLSSSKIDLQIISISKKCHYNLNYFEIIGQFRCIFNYVSDIIIITKYDVRFHLADLYTHNLQKALKY